MDFTFLVLFTAILALAGLLLGIYSITNQFGSAKGSIETICKSYPNACSGSGFFQDNYETADNSMKAFMCAVAHLETGSKLDRDTCPDSLQKADARCYGKACASCKGLECTVTGFNLPQYVNNMEKWMPFFGDPEIMVYWGSFPMEEDRWSPDNEWYLWTMKVLTDSKINSGLDFTPNADKIFSSLFDSEAMKFIKIIKPMELARRAVLDAPQKAAAGSIRNSIGKEAAMGNLAGDSTEDAAEYLTSPSVLGASLSGENYENFLKQVNSASAAAQLPAIIKSYVEAIISGVFSSDVRTSLINFGAPASRIDEMKNNIGKSAYSAVLSSALSSAIDSAIEASIMRDIGRVKTGIPDSLFSRKMTEQELAGRIFGAKKDARLGGHSKAVFLRSAYFSDVKRFDMVKGNPIIIKMEHAEAGGAGNLYTYLDVTQRFHLVSPCSLKSMKLRKTFVRFGELQDSSYIGGYTKNMKTGNAIYSGKISVVNLPIYGCEYNSYFASGELGAMKTEADYINGLSDLPSWRYLEKSPGVLRLPVFRGELFYQMNTAGSIADDRVIISKDGGQEIEISVKEDGTLEGYPSIKATTEKRKGPTAITFSYGACDGADCADLAHLKDVSISFSKSADTSASTGYTSKLTAAYDGSSVLSYDDIDGDGDIDEVSVSKNPKRMAILDSDDDGKFDFYRLDGCSTTGIIVEELVKEGTTYCTRGKDSKWAVYKANLGVKQVMIIAGGMLLGAPKWFITAIELYDYIINTADEISRANGDRIGNWPLS